MIFMANTHSVMQMRIFKISFIEIYTATFIPHKTLVWMS